jgi:hypothetical protein
VRADGPIWLADPDPRRSTPGMNAPSVTSRPAVDYIQDYADAKSTVIEEIISRAQGGQKQ